MSESEARFAAYVEALSTAVGHADRTGPLLNYVSPTVRFRGVSRAMMTALEARARETGSDRCRLVSTRTARQFYVDGGYVVDLFAPVDAESDSSLAMVKMLAKGDDGGDKPLIVTASRSPISTILVREAEVADRPALRDLWSKTWRATYEPLVGHSGLEEMLDGLDASGFRDMIPDDARVLVAVCGDQIVGSAIHAERKGTPYLWGMYVHPGFQRLGVGTDLLGQVAARLPSTAVIEVSALASSSWAQAFYSRFGFEATSARTIQLTQDDPGRPGTIMAVRVEDLRRRVDLRRSAGASSR